MLPSTQTRPSLFAPASLQPSGADVRAAARMGLSLGVPVVALLAAGHPELIIYAAFASFVGMYGRGEAHQLRLVHQGHAAVLLLGGSLLGMVVAHLSIGPWTFLGIEALLAAAASLLADQHDLKPTGPFFTIFAFGALASVPPAVPWWVTVVVSLGSATFSIMVGFSGWITGRKWHPGAVRAVVPPHLKASYVHALRYFLAVTIAGSIGVLLGIGHPYWAMASAVVPLAAESLNGRIRRGMHRILGTFAGVAVTALILWQHPPVPLLALSVALLLYPTELFMQRHYGVALVFFTPLILIMTLLAVPTPAHVLIGDRALETFIGAMSGIMIAVVIKEPRR